MTTSAHQATVSDLFVDWDRVLQGMRRAERIHWHTERLAAAREPQGGVSLHRAILAGAARRRAAMLTAIWTVATPRAGVRSRRSHGMWT